jgi:Ca2+-binding RTX toxin-like protein
MTGTDVKLVSIDLSALADGGAGDGAADTVIVNASRGADAIAVTQNGSTILVNGLAAQTTIAGSEAANDQLQINGLGGADIIDASALSAGLIRLTLNGGGGNDIVIGSAGNDILTGGGGAADDDTFVFRPGGGADVITDFTAGSTSMRSTSRPLPVCTSSPTCWRWRRSPARIPCWTSAAATR